MDKNNFLYQAHCEHGKPSVKLLYGGIGFMLIQICICTFVIVSIIRGDAPTGVFKDFFFFNLSISATLLGLTTLTNIFNGNKYSEPPKEKEPEEE